jgi:2-alkyl-3-oxoalkanoate reductase
LASYPCFWAGATASTLDSHRDDFGLKMAKQRVVVLGASGFIGRRVVGALADTDWAIPIAVSRHIKSADIGTDIESISIDATTRSGLEKVIGSATGVVSCITGSAQDIVNGGTSLFQAAAWMTQPPRVVYLSSLAAYGSARGRVDESSPLLGDLDAYSASKAEVEQLAEGLPFVIRLRPGIVYGPRSPWWTDRIGRLLMARRLGDLGAAGEGICNLVHVEDVAVAVLRALRVQRAAGEAFNLGSPEPPTWNEYFYRFAQSLGAGPVRRITRAGVAVELALYGPAMKLTEKILGHSSSKASQPVIRPWLTKLCRQDIRMDVRKAEEQLGMKWRSLEKGLAESAAWFLSGGRTR